MPLPLIAPTAEPIASQPPTDAQRIQIAGTSLQIGGVETQGFFSSLQQDPHLAIIGAENPAYNCISWSYGVTNAWNNPPQNPIAYFKDMGFKLCVIGDVDKKIAVWFNQDGAVTHAAVRKIVTIQGKSVWCWTSKLGESYCIAHSLDRLNGGIYGQPGMYFK